MKNFFGIIGLLLISSCASNVDMGIMYQTGTNSFDIIAEGETSRESLEKALYLANETCPNGFMVKKRNTEYNDPNKPETMNPQMYTQADAANMPNGPMMPMGMYNQMMPQMGPMYPNNYMYMNQYNMMAVQQMAQQQQMMQQMEKNKTFSPGKNTVSSYGKFSSMISIDCRY